MALKTSTNDFVVENTPEGQTALNSRTKLLSCATVNWLTASSSAGGSRGGGEGTSNSSESCNIIGHTHTHTQHTHTHTHTHTHNTHTHTHTHTHTQPVTNALRSLTVIALVMGWAGLPQCAHLINSEPSLREGQLMEDLALIFNHFLQHFSKTTHTATKSTGFNITCGCGQVGVYSPCHFCLKLLTQPLLHVCVHHFSLGLGAEESTSD